VTAPPPPPPAAVACFGERLPAAVAYAALLAGDGVVRGLIGPRVVPRLWDRHLLNCAAVAPLLPAGATVADLGSGAGLPGLVVALLRPDVTMTLIEPLLRRATFLGEAVAALGLERVTVLRVRAEDHPATPGYDAVLARAVAPLDRLAGWALPLLREDGRLLALKGATASDELTNAKAALRSLGATGQRVLECGVEGAEAPTTVVEVIAGPRRKPARPRVSRETSPAKGPR
jgi:16S rRNA (guanine527-N7)-methyltransferase